jgi:hypothetical protein
VGVGGGGGVGGETNGHVQADEKAGDGVDEMDDLQSMEAHMEGIAAGLDGHVY